MNILFVHQNFPGQFPHLATALSKAGHKVHALAIGGRDLPGVAIHRYKPARGTSRSTHPWAAEFETKVIRGEACARAATGLKEQGFTPDLIVAHPGWGESLFLKDVWPQARLMVFVEFYYRATGLDMGFDPEFAHGDLASAAKLRTKNTHLLLALESMDWGLCPTNWQKSAVPQRYHDRISVIFDGIDTETVRPDPDARITIRDKAIRAGDEVITFVSRNLEPYRGYHILMRILPEIQRKHPNAITLIVGGDETSYGAAPPQGKTWKRIFLDEVGKDLDRDRVFFLGKIPYRDYLKILQVSACHVYLTYPFVLSWSCVEALSAGCLVVGSATPPVQEVIEHGKNGLLVDFFDRQGWVDTVSECLANPQKFTPLRAAARKRAVERYDLKSVCLPQQLELVAKLARLA